MIYFLFLEFIDFIHNLFDVFVTLTKDVKIDIVNALTEFYSNQVCPSFLFAFYLFSCKFWILSGRSVNTPVD